MHSQRLHFVYLDVSHRWIDLSKFEQLARTDTPQPCLVRPDRSILPLTPAEADRIEHHIMKFCWAAPNDQE